ncbi:hypothetical protein KEM63_06945 [Halopseudomonas nanhaiensis]|uniref:hypothetical protein n=1 Tax=Halopseudomonas nanhaiensis TaxID=2830842 RepID=UPI001CBAE06A|nr:hypothetical protein [Halopseudomonas nanhaiensis]UAW99693.1 hypothetical protein KEM63_06945 [Halopseudomonas nanhaiensis]
MPALRLIAAALLCLASSSGLAADIAVVLPGETALTREFVEALRQRRPDDRVVVSLLQPDQVTAPSADFLVTMGQRSLAWRVALPAGAPTVATYVTPSSLSAIEQPLPDSVQALLASPKPERQLALARLLLPRLGKVGLLYSPQAAPRMDGWSKAADAQNLEVVSGEVADAGDLAKRVAYVLDASDVLVAPDDPAIYNADNLKTILLTSYARNKVLIGPSAPFIAAGSLSTTFSSPAQMADAVDRLIDQQWQPAAVSYPRDFSVLSNQQVARSLGLPIAEDEQLAEQIRAQETQP